MEKKNSEIKKNAAMGASASVGAAAGVVGGSLFTGELRAEEVHVEEPGKEPGKQNEEEVVLINSHDDEIKMATTVNDNMSFSEAFAAARAEVGPGGAFEWRGGLYGTYYAEEWNNMTAEQKAEYYSHFNWDSSHHGGYEAPEPKPEPVTNDVHHVVEVIGVEAVTDDYGNKVDLAYAKVDGHAGLMADYDRDGKADVLVVDYNDNGKLDEGETADLRGQNVEMPAHRPTPEQEVTVEVLSVQTIEDEQGNAMDVAVVKVNGHDGVIADVDRDGTADVLLVDANDNGVIENNEFADLRGQGVEMAALSAQVQDTPENVYYAQTDQDYVNDANVDDYFA